MGLHTLRIVAVIYLILFINLFHYLLGVLLGEEGFMWGPASDSSTTTYSLDGDN